MSSREVVLEVREVSKTFPGLRALDRVSLAVHAGEIVALVGHNGSGKSTLVKILAGVLPPDDGGFIGAGDGSGDERPARLHFIHQDLALVPTLSTVENLGLVVRGHSLSPVRDRVERRHARELIARFGGSFDVTVPVGRLSSAERAIVAIARALDGWGDERNLLVLDEPTEALHRTEVHELFDVVRRVAAAGAGVIFISHRLDEVLELADRAVVLRDGRMIADEPRAKLDSDRLVNLIAGIEPIRSGERVAGAHGEPVLRARGLRGTRVEGVDLDLAAGEIVGVSGVLGSGREALPGLLFGAWEGTADEFVVGGVDIGRPFPPDAIRAGVAFVPADRRRDGGVMGLTARENVTLPHLAPLRRFARRIDLAQERREVAELMERFGVRPAEPERPLELFSGGNQQKLVLAKWLRTKPRVLLLDEPTQGVDVGAKAAIYELITAAAADGTAILISSTDTEELARLCDRVIVLREGRIAVELVRPDITEARLLHEALGPAGNGKSSNGAEVLHV